MFAKIIVNTKSIDMNLNHFKFSSEYDFFVCPANSNAGKISSWSVILLLSKVFVLKIIFKANLSFAAPFLMQLQQRLSKMSKQKKMKIEAFKHYSKIGY